MIDPTKTDVGDIDLVVVTGWADGFDGRAGMERFDEMAVEIGGPDILDVGGLRRIIRDRDYVTNQLLYGGRKHPLLSLNDMNELQDMACPCQMVFDATRGGPVNDPVLPRHPKSQGRSDRMGEARSMPDMSEGRQPLRPLPADLTHPGNFHWRSVEAVGPWPNNDARCRLAQMAMSGMSLVVSDGELPKDVKANVVTKRLTLQGCDPRDRVGLIVSEHVRIDPDKFWNSVPVPRFGVIMKRRIEEGEASITYSVHIDDGATKGRSIDLQDLIAAEWWAYMLMTADVERILRREAENGLDRRISVEVSGQPDKPVADDFVFRLSEFGAKMVERTQGRIRPATEPHCERGSQGGSSPRATRARKSA